MFKRGHEIDGSVVLVTGASSGIGRAAARRFAESGADLVLTARSPEDIDRIALECQAHGSEVLTMLADVGDERQVQELAKVAIEHFGRIDAWINNAGVIAYGRFEDMPSEVFDGVIRTNLLGQVYGARAALEQFRRQGSGVLVNLASVWGRVTSPNVVPYVVSKHGIRAFSECLREGLAASEGTEDIHVVTVLPESVDTPIFQHAANYTGREVKPVFPVVGVQRAARAIVAAVRRPRGEITVGQVGHAVALLAGLVPRQLFERIAPRIFEHTALEESEAEPSPGNVLRPEPDLNRVEGGRRRGLGRQAGRLTVGVVGLGAPVVAAGLTVRRARHKG